MPISVTLINKAGGVQSFRFDHALSLLARQIVMKENEWTLNDPNFNYVNGKFIATSSPGINQGAEKPK